MYSVPHIVYIYHSTFTKCPYISTSTAHDLEQLSETMTENSVTRLQHINGTRVARNVSLKALVLHIYTENTKEGQPAHKNQMRNEPTSKHRRLDLYSITSEMAALYQQLT